MPFHSLRHTTASLLVAAGVQPRVVMQQLGHTTVAISMDRYSHVAPADRTAAATLEEALS